MEKLELKHIQYYDLSTLKFVVPALNNKIITASVVNIDLGYIECCEDGVRESYSIKFLKPLLRPLSDLYKEIDGKVGIVELAKIHDPDFDDGEDIKVIPKKGWYSMGHVDYWNNDGLECRFGWFNSFQAGYINPTRHCFVRNQLDLFTYLFSHHYDVSGLIDKGLAIDINTVQLWYN